MKKTLENDQINGLVIDYSVSPDGEFHFDIWTRDPDLAQQLMYVVRDLQEKHMDMIKKKTVEQCFAEKAGVD